jgi:iron(III) transport system ATP-binding protein
VLDNVAFGLRSLSGAARRARALDALAQVGMESSAKVYPHTLSGGQQQRVALARALAPKPRVMLLDEPFSGLDARLRNQVRDDTLHVLKESGAATLMVTHDPEEAMFMADRVALMCCGRLVQLGRPTDLYFAPDDAFVAGFFGEINHLEGVIRGGVVATPFGEVAAPELPEGTPVEVLIRPEALRLQSLADATSGAAGTAKVMASRMLGRSSLVHLSVTGGEGQDLHLHARIPGRFLPAEDEVLAIHLDRSQAFVFPLREAT